MQLTLTPEITHAQVVETSVTVNNSPIQDYVHRDDHTQPTHYHISVSQLAVPQLMSFQKMTP